MPWTGGGLADLMSASVEETKGIRFVAWDPDTPVQLQPKFDLIIHKLTEDIEKPESSAKLQALDEYLNKYPSTVIVDPISAVSKVTSRIRTNECLSNVQLRRGRSCPFRLPRSVVVQDGATPDEVIYQLEQKGLQFPVICKPVQACGTPDSHRMVRLRPSYNITPETEASISFFRW